LVLFDAVMFTWTIPARADSCYLLPSWQHGQVRGFTWNKRRMSTARIYDRPLAPGSRIAVILVIAIAGLFYVKWMPYYNKAFLAANTRSIGKSILMGTATQAPAASWHSALDFALAYGNAISGRR
jgi:hypothetical protein